MVAFAGSRMSGKIGPTTLLTRFAEELRRVLGIKPRQEPRPGRGRYGARGVKEEGWKVQGGRWKRVLGERVGVPHGLNLSI